ncbi:hypothetical protein AB0D85_18320, partial [Streptomyces sp. NPDC048277]
MSGLLTDLVERTLGLVPVLEPRPRSRFEPVAEDGFEVVAPKPVDGLPRADRAPLDTRPPGADAASVQAPQRGQQAERPVPGILPVRGTPDDDATPAHTPQPAQQAERPVPGILPVRGTPDDDATPAHTPQPAQQAER